jgi:hypothetical protein
MPDSTQEIEKIEVRLREKTDDRLGRAAEINKRLHDWAFVQSLTIAEKYIRGKINLVVRPAGNPAQDGIVFQAHPFFREIGVERCRSSLSNILFGEFGAHIDKSPVLAHNVQSVESKEFGGFIPSVVWLERFNNCYVGARKPLYLFNSRIEVIGGRFADGEISIFWRHMAVALGKRDRHEVQGTSNTMDHGAYFGVDDKRGWISDTEFNSVLAALRVEFVECGVRARFEPSFKSAFDTWELGYGPVDCGLGR